MLTGYLALFIIAYLAATVLPFSSELVLIALLQELGPGSAVLLVLIATTGNVLGSCVNWWLGSFILQYQHKRWFTFSQTQIAKAQEGFNRYGLWSLLLAWVPVIGDPLTLLAGVMRVRFPVFLMLVTTGKLLRYVFIAYASSYILPVN